MLLNVAATNAIWNAKMWCREDSTKDTYATQIFINLIKSKL